MKKYLLAICIITFLMGFNAGAQRVQAAEMDAGLSSEEAIRIGNSFVNDFNQIVNDGLVDQYFGTWAYDVLTEWRDVLQEIGTFYGIKSTNATVDSEKAVIKIEVHGTKRNAVIDFVLYMEQVPEITIYSKFSLSKWMFDSGVGAVLIIFNTVAVLALFILLIRKPKVLPTAEKNQAIDDTIARIIHNEEKTSEEAGETAAAEVAEEAAVIAEAEIIADAEVAAEAEAVVAEAEESK
ncbi:MAG: hypothetical protein FWE14_12270 [Lachnospiraceae bacterium]|nr:hypothetical protein [Lachnospiraceae bacterium]